MRTGIFNLIVLSEFGVGAMMTGDNYFFSENGKSSESANVVSIAVHPRYSRRIVSHDMDGVPLRVGDQFVDLTGKRGEIRQLLENDCASVVVDDYYRSFIVDTSTLLRVPGAAPYSNF